MCLPRIRKVFSVCGCGLRKDEKISVQRKQEIPGILVRMLYPDRCPFCGRILAEEEEEQLACRECMGKLEFIEENYCLKCGKPLLSETREYCAECERREYSFAQARALLPYSDEVRSSLYQFKNGNRRDHAQFYGHQIAERFESWIRRSGAEMIVPVPMYPARKRERGYNQAEVLADVIGRELDLPVEKHLLFKTEDTRQQKSLSAEERRRNLRHAFQAGRGAKGRRILLVDDIYTTGATLDAAAAALRRAGAASVYAVCAAIVGGE